MIKFGVLSFMLPSSHRTLSWTEVHEVWNANVVRALGNEVVRICWLTGRLWSKPTHSLDDSVLHFLAPVILYFIGVFLFMGTEELSCKAAAHKQTLNPNVAWIWMRR